MATKTDIELKIVDSVDTSHTDEEVLADSASNPDAFYVGRGYLAKGGKKVIESIDKNGTYPNVTVGNATKATTATTADKAVKDGGGKNIAENYALISDTVGKLGVLNSPADRSATIPNALTNAWGIDNTMFSVIIYERANSSATWVEKWNYATASVVQKTLVERGEATSNLFISTRGYQVKVVVSTTASNYIKALSLNIKTKDDTYSGNVDYTAYYGSSSTVAYNGSLGTYGANWGASFLETYAQNVEYIFNANRANASIVIRGYRICTNEPTNPILIGKALKAYEADKATTADTATRANTAATAATAVNISDAPVLTATEDEQITVKVGNKTSNPLTVPYAQRADFATDLSGRVEATPEVFTYRPSAGDKSIKDDNAFIRRVKGNSVVWNQLVKNALDQSGNNGWWSRQGANNVELNGSSIKLTFVSGSSYQPQITQKANFVLSHKYFVSFEIKRSVSKTISCFLRESIDLYGNSVKYILNMPTDGQYQTIYTSTGGYPYVFICVTDQVNDVGDSVTVSDVQLIDLTQMFGAGNEPTTVEEFRALYPNSYYPYNTGELRNLVCSGIKTVGFNLFDEDVMTSWSGITKDNRGWYGNVSNFYRDSSNNRNKLWVNTMGYTGQICVYIKSTAVDARTRFRPQIHYIDGTTNSYDDSVVLSGEKTSAEGYIVSDENKVVDFVGFTYGGIGYVIVNNFCINLHHTGYRDGEYEPYKEVTHALPLSQITNGEPLRKAGSVYDEINETEYIRRVGVVDLGSLKWVNAANNIFACTEMPNMIVTTDAALRLDGLFCTKYAIDTILSIDATMSEKTMKRNNGWLYIKDTSFTDVASFKASLSGVLLHYELAEPIVKPIETPIDFNYYVEDFGTEEAILAENSAPFSADIIYQFNATDQVRNNTRNIQRLKKTAFTPSGTTAQYIRGDGSYADVSELASVIPINDGEGEGIDNEDGGQNLEFRLFPQYYAKSVYTADADMYKEVIIRVEAPDNTDFVAEYWLELEIGESIPQIRFENQDNVGTSFRFNGEIRTDAVNIWHLITTDGGKRYFGEIKSYLTE